MLEQAIASVAAQTVPPEAHLVGVDHHQQGPAKQLNQLIRAAETEWIAVLPDDDLLDPNHLQLLLQAGDGADLVYSWCRFLGEDRAQYRGPFDGRRLLARLDTGIRAVFLLRKQAWIDVGGYDETLLNDDWDLLRRLAESHTIRLVPRETWSYRIHPGSLSHQIQLHADGQPMTMSTYLSRHLEIR